MKKPAKNEHVVLDGAVHRVFWHNDDYFHIDCVIEYPQCFIPRTLQMIVTDPVSCIECIAVEGRSSDDDVDVYGDEED